MRCPKPSAKAPDPGADASAGAGSAGAGFVLNSSAEAWLNLGEWRARCASTDSGLACVVFGHANRGGLHKEKHFACIQSIQVEDL